MRAGVGVNAVVRCEEVRFSFRRGFTLGPLSLTLTQGITCLVGANGAGKSTLFSLLVGIQRPQSGSIRIEGTGSVGFLPQSPDLPEHATCGDFLHHVAWLQGVPGRQRAEAVATALGRVDLTDRARTSIGSLSGGMARRVGIAQAIVHDPDVLLLDEPTVGLDPIQRLGVRAALKDVASGRVVVVSTHLVEDVRGLAERVLLMSEGRLVFDGDVPALERKAAPGAPGETELERALATLMAGPA